MVVLREITKENYEECLNLNIADSQKNFVSSTAHSLAQAWVYYNTAFPFAIYVDDVMVGFIMLGYYEEQAYYVTNCVARNLYASVGFCETGERVGNEIGMKLTIGNCIESNCGK